MNLINTITAFIDQHNLINKNDTIIVGLSGGPDSIFLLHLLLHLRVTHNLTLIAAHLNHEWRGAESDKEQEMCRMLCIEKSVTFVSEKLSNIRQNKPYNGSKEEYARNSRRIFFEHIAQLHSAQSIALGHHAQDQQETFFIRLIRGTSLTGLTCMKPHHNKYIRPLLNTNKNDILAWLLHHSIPFAVDSSNTSPLYLRNRIRMSALPVLRECDQRFDSNFLSTLEQLHNDEQYLQRATHLTFEKIIKKFDEYNSPILLDISLFFTIDEALHKRLILHWLIAENVQFPTSRSFFNEIIRFMRSPKGGAHKLTHHWSMIKKKHYVHIQKI